MAYGLTTPPAEGGCLARTGIMGGLSCELAEHPPATRHRDPATGLPWHSDGLGRVVIGPPAMPPGGCGAGYIWQTPRGAIELHCDTPGGHDRHHDPATGWHWHTSGGLLTVEAQP